MKTFTLFFLLFTVSQIYGQSNFQRGFIITNEQDTISGWIDFRTDARNMAVCNFKLCETCEVTTFLPGEIFGYRFYEVGKFYVSREIVINGEPRTVFLEFLVQGMMNLFYYVVVSNEFDKVKYFFFEDQNGRMIPLTRRPDEFITDERGRLRVREDLRYRGVIRYIFNEQESISQQADRIRFSRLSMVNIVREYHDLTCPIGEECIIFKNENPNRDFRRTQFSIYGGVLASMSFDATAPLIGGRLNISDPRLNRNLSFQVDLGIARTQTQNETIYILPFQIGARYVLGRESNILRPAIGVATPVLFGYSTQRPTSFVTMAYSVSLGLEIQTSDKYTVLLDAQIFRNNLRFNDAFYRPLEMNSRFELLQISAGIRF